MKLTLTSLFILLLAVILLSHLGFSIKEGMEVRRRDIPPGDEDLYILKSNIVPPVCPKCPENASCPRQTPCPPCPPCARCPEPAFTCKKVPDYSAANVDGSLPLPMLNSFAAFA